MNKVKILSLTASYFVVFLFVYLFSEPLKEFLPFKIEYILVVFLAIRELLHETAFIFINDYYIFDSFMKLKSDFEQNELEKSNKEIQYSQMWLNFKAYEDLYLKNLHNPKFNDIIKFKTYVENIQNKGYTNFNQL